MGEVAARLKMQIRAWAQTYTGAVGHLPNQPQEKK